MLRMPRKAVQKHLDRFSKRGEVAHRPELLAESDYTIVQRFQSVLRGVYDFYCMAINVGTRKRMGYIRWILETSLTKALARKRQCSVSEIYHRYGATVQGLEALQVVIERPDKNPRIATFGGFPFKRRPEGMGVTDVNPQVAWLRHHTGRAEVVKRLMAGRCELCEVKGVPLAAHHIRKLADIDRPGRRPGTRWERIMSSSRRKTIVLCARCHEDIHAGRHDGPRL
jgi:hypothetical protein